MPGDERVDAIFEAAEELAGELETAIQNKDIAAQRLLGVKLARRMLELKRIETAHRLILRNVMKRIGDARDQGERVEKLLAAFNYAAWVRSRAQDDLADDDLGEEAETDLQIIVSGLDAIKPAGRKALLPLLDSHNDDQRVCAAVALLGLMPDRVVPILRELLERAPGTNAGATAHAALDARAGGAGEEIKWA